MVGPAELFGFLFVCGIVLVVFGAIVQGMDSGSRARRRTGSSAAYTPSPGGAHVSYTGHDPVGHTHHHADVCPPPHSGHDASPSPASGFDCSTSFDVGFGAGGDGGFSGGGFDGGGCGGCDSGGGGGGGGD